MLSSSESQLGSRAANNAMGSRFSVCYTALGASPKFASLANTLPRVL
jgi:hypothetical protein